MIDNKFALQDRVKILELEIVGIVFGIWIGNEGLSYKVRYFWQGIFYEIYFYEKELEKC